jgi:hypothetical protein
MEDRGSKWELEILCYTALPAQRNYAAYNCADAVKKKKKEIMRPCTQNGHMVLHYKLGFFFCVKKICHEVRWSWRPRNLANISMPVQYKNVCWNVFVEIPICLWESEPPSLCTSSSDPSHTGSCGPHVGVVVRPRSVRCRSASARCIASPTCCIFVMGDAAALGEEEKQYKSLDDVIMLNYVHLTKLLTNLREILPQTNGMLWKHLKQVISLPAMMSIAFYIFRGSRSYRSYNQLNIVTFFL